MGQTTDAPLREAVLDTRHYDLTELTVERHGGTKVASENAVRERLGKDRSFIVRPGIISGPGDRMDRFGYWAVRFSRGGQAVVPNSPHQPIRHIDAIGPVLELGAVLRGTAHLVGAADLELVAFDPETLAEAGINPPGGPRSLPL